MTIRTYVKMRQKSTPIRGYMDPHEYYDKNEGLDTLSREVFEAEPELIDTGLLDHDGNKIMVQERMLPIGYIWFND